ncbi:MAG: radical SAM protein [Nitrospirae bacterium]|nr:radical SAM protein [Nitrospirota bacterium]MBI3593790.1 radical SAM protein [Nitrospirota bacterium]
MGKEKTVSASHEPVNRLFRVVFIKPSHYDDEGYIIRWGWSCIPSNTLACLYGITQSLNQSRQLGKNIEVIIDVYDETNQRIPVKSIIRQLKSSGPREGIVCMAGVQSNQFPRAIDLARQFRTEGIEVLIGGFHVSGCLSMLEAVPDDLKAAMEEGITLVAGEVEESLGEIFIDVINGRLKRLYNYMKDLPALEGQPPPILPMKVISRYVGTLTTFDAGRGCPFDCSFCTIINVQGKKSRGRSADDIEWIIRENHRRGITRYFITDDDFARNRNWESIFDRMIALREKEGLKISFTLQVDTACHRLSRFIEKAGKAGCTKVFLGMESVNPESLKATGKKQNHVEEYREMLQAWRRSNVVTYAGYIIGFPNDTYESVMRDVEILKRELPLDLVEFFVLTPLPGSEDHQTLVKNRVWLDPDMNKYDTEHPCQKHPKLSQEEWIRTYQAAWKSFYTFEHIKTIFRRRWSEGHSIGKILGAMIWFCGAVFIEGVHPLQAGIIRRKHRSERRPGTRIESRITFAWRRIREVTLTTAKAIRLALKLHFIRRKVEREGPRGSYIDLAITPVAPKRRDLHAISVELPLSIKEMSKSKADKI